MVEVDHVTSSPLRTLADPVECFRSSIPNFRSADVVIASYPGAGAALIGNMLLEAGVPYLDPYTEYIEADGARTVRAEVTAYRQRIAAQGHCVAPAAGDCARFIKTHLYPGEFAAMDMRALVLLVRDPRDCLFSYYNWRLGFSEEGETRSFAGFLDGPGYTGRTPLDDWAAFHSDWLARAAAVERFAIVSFESLKRSPTEAVTGMFATLDMSLDPSVIDAAIAASSFERMRAHEDSVAGSGGARIMRRGAVGEWQAWYDAEQRARFGSSAIPAVAQRLGYGDLR